MQEQRGIESAFGLAAAPVQALGSLVDQHLHKTEQNRTLSGVSKYALNKALRFCGHQLDLARPRVVLWKLRTRMAVLPLQSSPVQARG